MITDRLRSWYTLIQNDFNSRGIQRLHDLLKTVGITIATVWALVMFSIEVLDLLAHPYCERKTLVEAYPYAVRPAATTHPSNCLPLVQSTKHTGGQR